MARRRGQKKGHLRRKGPSWLLTYREYIKDENGNQVPKPVSLVIAPATGPEAVSKREATRIAWDDYLSKLDARNVRPGSTMLVRDFVSAKFKLQVVERKKPSGQKHYDYLLENHVLPSIGHRRLCDINLDDVETVVAEKQRAGYSWQTLLHIRNCVSAVFRHAKRLRLYADENPAAGVEMQSGVTQRKRPGYTWEQASKVLAKLKSPAREMAMLSVATSMNVAEMCGIRLKWCNFAPTIAQVEGEVLAPWSIGVRENYYAGRYGDLKTGKRCRNVGMPPEFALELATLVHKSKRQDLDAPLFQSRNGTPVDAHNISNRHLRPLSVKLGFPVTWHAFRRAHSSFADQIGVPLSDRVATMGHADARMTLYYSVEDVERRREVPKRILERLTKAKAEPISADHDIQELPPAGGVQ